MIVEYAGSFIELLAKRGMFLQSLAKSPGPKRRRGNDEAESDLMPKKPAKAKPVDTDDRRLPCSGRVAASRYHVIWRDDKVLSSGAANLRARSDWGLPGGMQDVGETVIEAAVREAREETGLGRPAASASSTALDSITRDAKEGEVEFRIRSSMPLANQMRAKRWRSRMHEVRWATTGRGRTFVPGWPEVARIVRLSAVQRALCVTFCLVS